MKKVLTVVLAVVMLVSLMPVAVAAGNGNDAPPGKHFNLNIIGVPNPKNWDGDSGGNGSRIFILRTGTTTFYVHGDNITYKYAVLDHDGTDGSVGTSRTDPGITFPYDFNTGKWQVDIWVRLVGPKSEYNKLDIEVEKWEGDDYGHWATINLSKSSKFVMHGRDLLADGYQDMLWTMEPGTKFRICQMRIYLVQRQ